MNNKSVLIFSLVFGIATFFITTIYLSNVSHEQKLKNEMVPTVVAKMALPAKTVLNKEMLEIKRIPRQYLTAGTFARPEDLLDKVVLVPMLAGEQINASKVSIRNRQMGLAVIIPKNKRAVSVEVDASASIAGLIKPGDMVDVVCTLEELNRTVTMLQNIQILAIDQQMEGDLKGEGKGNRAVIATLALDVQDSEKLVLASTRGRLKLLLRPLDDDSTTNSWGATIYQLLPYTPNTGRVSTLQNIRLIKGTKVEDKKL